MEGTKTFSEVILATGAKFLVVHPNRKMFITRKIPQAISVTLTQFLNLYLTLLKILP